MKRCKQERGRSWGKTKKKEEKKGNVRSQEVCKNVTGEREEEEEVGCAGECDSSMPGGQLFELGTLLSLKHEKITPQLEPNLQEMSESPSRICLEEVEKKKNKLNVQIHLFHFTLAGGLCVQKYQQVLGCNDKIW